MFLRVSNRVFRIEVVGEHLFSAEEIGSELVDGNTVSILDNVDGHSHILTLPVSFHHEIEIDHSEFDPNTEEIFEFHTSELTEVECVNIEHIEESEPTIQHVEEPVKKKKFSCDKCDAVFLREVTLKYHQSVHVEESYYACEFCPATKIPWTEFYLHQCSNVESKPLRCSECNAAVSSKKQLQVHIDVHSLQKRFSSKKLEAYFQRKLADVEDKKVDWGSKPFICGVCGKQFNKLYEVEYHEKLHNLERESPHSCQHCGLVYINKQDLNKHSAKGCQYTLARPTQ